MRNFRLIAVAALMIQLSWVLSRPLLAQEAPAQDQPALSGSIEDQVKALDKKVKELQKKAEAQGIIVVTQGTGGTGFPETGKEILWMKSADENVILNVGGVLQADGRFYVDNPKTEPTNTFLLRRARIIVQGTLFHYYDFRIMPDFAGSTTVLYDAFLDIHYWMEARLRVGKFKPPIGLEQLQEDRDVEFVERALPTQLVPNRDVGAQLWGDLLGGTVTYYAGIFNGVPDAGNVVNGDKDTNNDKDYEGRIFTHPFKLSEIAPLAGLGVGVSGSYGHERGAANVPTYVTTGQSTFFSYLATTIAAGGQSRISPQGDYYWGPLGFLGEYVSSSLDVSNGAAGKLQRTARVVNQAWQTAATVVLTGEKASFIGVRPRNRFDPKNGNWGAFELAARYSTLKVDGDAFPLFASAAVSARQAEAWGTGINWYLTSNVKAVVDYEQTDFKGGAAAGLGNRPVEKVVLSRFQIVF